MTNLQRNLGKLLLPNQATIKQPREPRFEVLWYTDEDRQNDPMTKTFFTRKKALAYYNEHKNDKGCYYWEVTHRDADWYVIEDIIW